MVNIIGNGLGFRRILTFGPKTGGLVYSETDSDCHPSLENKTNTMGLLKLKGISKNRKRERNNDD